MELCGGEHAELSSVELRKRKAGPVVGRVESLCRRVALQEYEAEAEDENADDQSE